jgi:hypothetical protein
MVDFWSAAYEDILKYDNGYFLKYFLFKNI